MASHCVIHRLKLHLPAGPSAEHRLPANIRWELGRDPGCDVQIDHPSVSRRHARLEGDAQHGWLLEDLGSKNGTRFGGQPVRQLQRLRNGDWFALGDVYAVIEDVPPDRHSAEISQAQIRRQTSQLWLKRLAEFERPDPTAAKAQPHSTSLDRTEQLMADLLRAVVEVAEAKRAFLVQLDEDGQWRVRACHGLRPDALQRAEFGGSRGALERTLRTHLPTYYSQTSDAAALGARASVIAGGIQALACLPLLGGDQLLGAVYADSDEPGRSFDSLDARLLEALVSQAGTVLAAQDLQDRLAMVGRWLAVAPEGAEAVGPSPTLQLALGGET